MTPDGLELDWMRFGYHLTPGREREEGTILTQFVRDVRALTKEWSAKRGHPMYLAVRVPAHPDAATGLGMDAVAWAREGLVDMIIPCPFWSSSDFDIPVELWRERLGTLADQVTVAPGLEYNARPWPGGEAVANDLACARGFAASAHYRGADSIYLFNWMDSETRPVALSDYQVLLRDGLSPQAVSPGQRVGIPVCYRDTVPGGFPNGAQLPVDAQAGGDFQIPIGPAASLGRRVGRCRTVGPGHCRDCGLGGIAQRPSVRPRGTVHESPRSWAALRPVRFVSPARRTPSSPATTSSASGAAREPRHNRSCGSNCALFRSLPPPVNPPISRPGERLERIPRATISKSTASRFWSWRPNSPRPAGRGSGMASSSVTNRRPISRCLERGFHVVYMSVPDMLGCPQAVQHWNAFYRELTEKYGFAKKAALVGLSRGGLYCYNWACANPDKVACIYADAAVCDFKSWPGGKGKGKGSPGDWQLVLERYGFANEAEALAYDKNPVDNLAPLAKAHVPLLHVYGDADDVVPWDENTGHRRRALPPARRRNQVDRQAGRRPSSARARRFHAHRRVHSQTCGLVG